MLTMFSSRREERGERFFNGEGAAERERRARRSRHEGMLVFVVVAVATMISIAMVPAAVGASPEMDAKGGRLPSAAVAAACAGQAWGQETHGCLTEIARAGGMATTLSRIIVTVATEPNGPANY